MGCRDWPISKQDYKGLFMPVSPASLARVFEVRGHYKYSLTFEEICSCENCAILMDLYQSKYFVCIPVIMSIYEPWINAKSLLFYFHQTKYFIGLFFSLQRADSNTFEEFQAPAI